MSTTVEKPVKAKKGKLPRPPKPPKAVKGSKMMNEPQKPTVHQWPDPYKPQLNFLPPKLRGARARRKATRQAIAGAVVVLVLTGFAYASVVAGAATSRVELDQETQISAQHQDFLSQNKSIGDYFAGYIDRKAAVTGALEQDVDYSKVIAAVQSANKVNATFTSIKLDSIGSCGTAGVLGKSNSIGCLTIIGSVSTVSDAGAFATALGADQQILTDPYLTETIVTANSDGTPPRTNFTLSVGFTPKAYSFKGEQFRPTDDEKSTAATAKENK